MTKTTEHPQGSPTTLERRRHPRREIFETCYIDLLDGANGGLVLDVSETGLSFQSALKVTDNMVSRIRFRLPSSDQWIEARAQLAWLAESGKKAGVLFQDLSEDARTEIRQYVANEGLSRSPVHVPGDETVSQQTIQEESRTPAAIPVTSHAQPVAAPRPAQKQNWSPPPSAARPEREAKLPWWGLGTVLCWVVLAVAVLLGLTHSSQLRQLPMLGRFKQTPSLPVKAPEAVVPPSGKAVTPSAPEPPKAPSTEPPSSAVGHEELPASATSRQSAPLSSPPDDADSTFGTMVTQTLSPGPTVTDSSEGGFQTGPRTKRYARPGPQSTDASFPAPADAPEPSHDSVLVGAPAVGAAPTRVVMEREPVSASSFVAITESRSILVAGSYDPTEELQLGKLVSYVEPAYPNSALAREVQGSVRVRAFVDRSGEVLRVQLLSGSATLAPAAIRAISKWRYDPTLLNGEAIESQADITVFFRLH